MSRLFKVNPQVFPFESHWMEFDGFKIHYLDEGSGLPVVLLHGNPTWCYLYRKVIKQLNSKVRAIAIDYPGFGFSTAPTNYEFTPQEHSQIIEKVVERLNLERFVLVLQDWGGPIGINLATRRPHRIAGLVLCNTWAWKATFKMKVFSWIFGGPFGNHFVIKKNYFLTKILPSGISNPFDSSEENLKPYRARFTSELSRKPVAVFPRAIRTSGDWLADIESRLGVLKDKPVQLVWGMKDPAFGKNKKFIERWQSHFPNSSLKILPQGNHYLPEDAPGEIAAAIFKIAGV